MASDIQEALNQDTIAALQELIEINIDSYNGFTQAANLLKETALRDHFSDLAQERIRQAVKLKQIVNLNDQRPIIEGSFAGRIHRAIMDWRDKFGDGPLGVLAEVERGEDYMKAKYEAVLTRTAGSAVTEVINRQYADVQRAHDRISKLRQTYSAS